MATYDVGGCCAGNNLAGLTKERSKRLGRTGIMQNWGLMPIRALPARRAIPAIQTSMPEGREEQPDGEPVFSGCWPD